MAEFKKKKKISSKKLCFFFLRNFLNFKPKKTNNKLLILSIKLLKTGKYTKCT